MRIAVTGLKGFIGRNLLEAALKAGVEVVALDRSDLLGATSPNGLLPDVSLRLSEKIARCDALIHLAGLAHRRKSTPDDFARVNHHLTVNLAQCTKSSGVNRFVYVSSILVYGKNDGKFKINAQTLPNPSDEYGKSKLNAEIGLQKLAMDSKHFKVIILRPPLVVGRGAGGNLQTLRNAISRGIPFPNINNNRRHLIGVRNFVAALLQATRIPIEGSTKIFPISDKTPVSTLEIIQEIGRGLRRSPRFVAMPKILRSFIMAIPFLSNRVAPLFLDYEIDSSEAWDFLGIRPEIPITQELFAVGEGIS